MTDTGSKITGTWPLLVAGLMQMVRKGDFPEKISGVFLLMIDMDAGDMLCIYTTLSFVSKHACENEQPTIVTFDQRLH